MICVNFVFKGQRREVTEWFYMVAASQAAEYVYLSRGGGQQNSVVRVSREQSVLIASRCRQPAASRFGVIVPRRRCYHDFRLSLASYREVPHTNRSTIYYSPSGPLLVTVIILWL